MTTRSVAVALLLVVVATAAPFGAGTAAAAEAGGCSFPVSETDDTGTTVTLSEPPERIVTLNPSAAQTIYEISASGDPAWDRVVGVSQYADYLPGADAKTDVGSGYTDATVEQTVALDPDLVLAPNTVPVSVVDQLRSAGLTVYRFRAAEDIDDVVTKTELTGRLVGECDGADDTAETMETQLDIVRDALRDEERPTAVYYFFGFTAGDDTFVDEIMTTAGVENMAATGDANSTRTSGFFRVNAEVVVAEDPQWFLLNGDQYSEARVPAGPNGAFTETTAYAEGNAVRLDANEISQPAPRVVNAVLDVVEVVHPEAYEEEIRDRLDRSDDLGGERAVRSRALADGSVRLEARNLGRERSVSFAVPSRANASAVLQRLNVSLATLNPSFTVDLTYPDADRGPPTLNGTHEFARFALEPNGLPAEDVDRLRFRFAVNETALADRDAAASNVTLYRHDGQSWSALDTRVVERANGSVVFEATSPGASTFVVGVPETESARAVTATPTPDPTATPDPELASEPTETPTAVSPTATPGASTTSTSTPGFGPVVAVVALSLVAVLARTRE